MTMALLSAPPLPSRKTSFLFFDNRLSSHKTSFLQRPYSTSFGSIAFIKYLHQPTIPLSTTTSTASTAEDEPTGVENSPFSGCKACGRKEIERGCNGEGRIQGGIATVPGFGWWPIKAYRPCPAFVASGGRYTRQGQSMDDVASGRGKKVFPLKDK